MRLAAPTQIQNPQHALAELQREIEELRQCETELRRSNRELEAFAYVVSHDLQEPLRTVSSFAQLLVRHNAPQLGAEGAELLRYVIDGSMQMQERIQGLLAYSRAGAAESQATVDLNEVLAQALAGLGAALREDEIQIAAGHLPSVIGDRVRLLQVFQNVTGNALKYRCPTRTAQLKIGAKLVGEFWEIAVEDNGIGFAPAQAGEIFNLFCRLHESSAPGTGLGLAIAKRVIESHGGRIWAEGEPGRGATIFFTLPRVERTLLG